jgi:DNA-binding NarL/FixJ family response regulator
MSTDPERHPPRALTHCWQCGALLLTPREQDVLTGLWRGLSLPQIAHNLLLAESTVNIHRDRLYKKLGVNSKEQALRVAMAQGLLPLRGRGETRL